MDTLHTYFDGTKLVRTTFLNIRDIPTWKGNRILDTTHVREIILAIQKNRKDIRQLDSGYHIITYSETDAIGNPVEVSYLIDGQHRREAIKMELGLCENFQITCCITHVSNEAEAIQKFNEINSSKPIQFKEDITQIANRFIEPLVKKYGTKQKDFIRSKKTTRPYCYVEDIRQTLIYYENLLREQKDADKFMDNVRIWNERKLRDIEIELSGIIHGRAIKDTGIKERAIKMGWVLGVEGNYSWIKECLESYS